MRVRKNCKHKRYTRYLCFVIAITGAFTIFNSQASDIADNDLNSFTPSSPVIADEFNQNFTVVKDAINTKQDKITGCGANFYMESVNTDGTSVCKPISTGMASVQNGNAVSINRNFQNIVSLNVTPPSAGHLLVNATMLTMCGDDYDGFYPTDVQLTKIASTNATSPAFKATSVSQNNSPTTFTATYQFAVEAENTTIILQASCSIGFTGSITVQSLNTVFSPNNIQSP